MIDSILYSIHSWVVMFQEVVFMQAMLCQQGGSKGRARPEFESETPRMRRPQDERWEKEKSE
jgi:hypothetical protein